MANSTGPEVSKSPAPEAAPMATAAVGMNGPFPAELAGWNWGAFLLTWVWGIGHSVWIALLALLSFIPFVGQLIYLGMAIYLGMKGNELAWQNRKFESVDQFRAVEKEWTKWAIILFILGAVLSIGAVILFFFIFAASPHTGSTSSF